jgi:hypothetical protein
MNRDATTRVMPSRDTVRTIHLASLGSEKLSQS